MTFDAFAKRCSDTAGKAWFFGLWLCLWPASWLLAWATDALAIRTAAVTEVLSWFTLYLGLIIIRNQNREGLAERLKTDELVRAAPAADNRLIGAEERSEDELERMKRG